MLDPLPASVEAYWRDFESRRGGRHVGRYSWTLKTYLYLRRYGVACDLVHHWPQAGIVVSHRDFLEDLPAQSVGNSVLLACIKADRPPLETADLHIVQNPTDPLLVEKDGSIKAAFVPYWPQEPILPRDPARGTELRNVAYLGRAWNLAPECQTVAWERALQQIGLDWQITPPERWNDYHSVDVLLAVRSFQQHGGFHHKPASKLVNAWHAGVPAILGPESAYRVLRRDTLDYLEVDSHQAALQALRRLKHDPALYQGMVQNGLRRAQDFTPERIAMRWEKFLQQVAWPAWAKKIARAKGKAD